MPETMSGPAYDLLVIRTVRDRILAGDWTQGRTEDAEGRRCLTAHIDGARNIDTYDAVREIANERGFTWISNFNDTHTQADVIALLDDVEDSLLGEMGVAR